MSVIEQTEAPPKPKPVLCPCVVEQRKVVRRQHIERYDALRNLAYRLDEAGHLTEDEVRLLYQQSNREWDDAIHIASTRDPLRSLCGLRGRNLIDLPERPDSGSGCWTCLYEADRLASRDTTETT